MKLSKKLWLCLGISISLLAVKLISYACGPWPAAPDEYRISFFQSGIGDRTNEFLPYYFSLSYYYKRNVKENYPKTIELQQNYTEWKEALNSNFSLKDFKQTIEYDFKVISDSANELAKANSFIRTLNKKAAFKNYFLLAKETEQFNSVTGGEDRWGLDETKKIRPQILINKLEDLLKKTNNSFIKQRTAYILCRLLFYFDDKENFNKTYTQYLQSASNKSWIKYAAKYYYVRLCHKNDEEFYMGLLDVIEHSKDKRVISMMLLNDDDFKNIISSIILKTNHDKALLKAIKTLNYPGYALNDIKKISELDKDNVFLLPLISREINKLEDWLFTTISTEYKTSASKDQYEYGDESEYFKNQNRKNDLKYAQEFKTFIESLLTHSKRDELVLNAYLSHINLMLGNNDEAIKNCDYISQHATTVSKEYLQARVNTIIAQIDKIKGLDNNLQSNLYTLLQEMDNSHNSKPAFIDEYYGQTDPKESILNYLAKRLEKYGDIVHTTLLLNTSTQPWGEYSTGYYKDAYIYLFENAKPADYDLLIQFVKNKNKTKFEKYCAQHISNDNFEYDRDLFANTNILYDLKGTYYVNKDSLEQALAAFNKVDKSYWSQQSTASSSFLTGNPFELNIYNTHSYSEKDKQKDNPNKATFISKLINLKNWAEKEKNKEVKARLYYQIGNAYFSMSCYGKYWIMSKLWWSRYDDEYPESTKNVDASYYSTSRAKNYYSKAFDLTRDTRNAAFFTIYISYCENNKKKYEYYIKRRATDSYDNYTWDSDLGLNSLKAKVGNTAFYERLINECPLYLDFKSKL